MSFWKKLFTLGGNETYNQAMGYYNQCRYEEAIRVFKKLTEGRLGAARLYPILALFYSGQAYRNLGMIDMHEGRDMDIISRVSKHLDPHLPEIMADGEQLYRVFINLASNDQNPCHMRVT